METIVQQIALDLAKNILEKAFNGGISDIDNLAAEALTECKTAAREIIQAISDEINLQIRKDKAGRKIAGLSLKEKERPRRILTQLGELDLKHDYYYDKGLGHYTALLDAVVGIEKYERIGKCVSASLVSSAAEVSYAKSAGYVTDGAVSRQSVRNHILKLGELEKTPESEEKRQAKVLHVYADEDHVHMQKPNKARGKKNKIVPLVTVTEGIHQESERRNRTVNPMYFVNENFNSKKLWQSVEGYIGKVYDTEMIEKIYVHGDGGKWIESGLNTYRQAEHVMDGYHLGKYFKEISRQFPKQNVRSKLENAVKENDKCKADMILQKLLENADSKKESEKVKTFGKYMMSNWGEIVKRRTLDIPGSCTEAQVSHVLSERFSRDPLGWSEEGLGKLTKLRIYIKNGGKVGKEDFKAAKKNLESYSDYAEKVIQENIAGRFDWSMFEPGREPFDIACGTQTLISSIGSYRNTLIN